jgi:hypothetical protein
MEVKLRKKSNEIKKRRKEKRKEKGFSKNRKCKFF